jgi:hypothetical protein
VSVKAIAWAWEQQVPSTVKFVLVALADNADDDGVCWPGQKFVAGKTCLTRRSVSKSVSRLVELKLVEVQHRVDHLGRPISNVYRLCLKRGGNENDVPLDRELNSQGIENDVLTEPSLRTVNEPDRPNVQFEDFYRAYPRHEAKADALKAWNKLGPGFLLQTTIIAGLIRYVSTDKRYIPLPASYLRGRRWEDESTVAGGAAKPPPEAVMRARTENAEPIPDLTPEQRAANRAFLARIREGIA